ncbi:MAG TPA: biotin transporter BioY [Chloroflexota bacterium]|nr:biotin transporter BioY [Chloroflexota bacterium]
MAVMIDAAAPQRRVWQDALLVVAGSLLVALSASIAIWLPNTPVPVTAQTLTVLLTGALLGSRLGSLALLTYLAEGLAGLPVFAGGTNAWSPSRIPGVPTILGPTAGYLVGFVVAAWLTGWLSERNWDRRVHTALLAMLAGQAMIYVCGLSGLVRFAPAANLFELGVLPFLVGDAIKIALGAMVLPAGWVAVQHLRK